MRRIISLFALLSFAPALELAQAQADTAEARTVYAEINGKLGSYRKVKATAGDDVALQGWLAGRELRKIVATIPGEHGQGVEEYYLRAGGLVFFYGCYDTENIFEGKVVSRTENRCYFQDGRMFKWLDNEKKSVAPGSEEFQAKAKEVSESFEAYEAALLHVSAVGSLQMTEGTFAGIEQGDYAHWKMRTNTGEKISYFILKPDASVEKILDNPSSQIGQKCRVQWKSTVENIPEAGGKINLSEIVSVEWPKPKS